MSKDKLLFDNDWLQIRMKEDEKGRFQYVYSHEKRSDGRTVAILPFRNFSGTMSDGQIMMRKELTPPWSTEKRFSSAMTGGVEGNNSPEDAAIEELKEEAGYNISKNELIPLGNLFLSKATDTTVYLFAVDVTNKEQQKPNGDGTYLESIAESYWSSNLNESVDPLSYVLYFRLLEYLYNH